jgi:ubiquinone/menaquinone biosynthesis C-methylase UbiE
MRKTLHIDSEVEEVAKQALRDFLQNHPVEYQDKQIEFLFDLNGGFVERFIHFDQFLNDEDKDHLLVSGCAVGSELLEGLNWGFRKVSGTEVSQEYIDICALRLKNYDTINHTYYNGMDLPFEDNSFSAILSGHIIEHTGDPYTYLKEHFRTLRKGGHMYLEFPDRNNDIELHTNTRSYEKHPIPLRYMMLSLQSINPKNTKQARYHYKLVRDTLVPVSVKDIEKWLTKAGIRFEIKDVQIPHKGFTRVIIKKESA